MSNPLEDYLTERPKTAAFPFSPRGLTGTAQTAAQGFGKKVLEGVGSSAVDALGKGVVGGGAAALGVASMKIYRAVRKREDFKQMMAANPDLHELQASDPAKFNAHYTSLRAMVPAYSQDPIISGTLMRTMSLNPQNAGSVLMQSMESRSKTSPDTGFSMGPVSYKPQL